MFIMVNFALALTTLVSVIGVALCDNCGQIHANEVSQADITTIVNKHNALRSLISQGKVQGQPKGTNLKTIQWDQKLGDAAQKIANSCIFAHQKVEDSRFYVGQNLYAWWTTSSKDKTVPDWNSAIQAWFNEHVNFQYPNISHGTTGHYTQVVWADTYLVGCGFIAYGQYNKYYVCNYGPGGNYVGVPPYKT